MGKYNATICKKLSIKCSIKVEMSYIGKLDFAEQCVSSEDNPHWQTNNIFNIFSHLFIADIKRAVLSNGTFKPDFTKLKLISGKICDKYEFSSDGRFHLSGNEIFPLHQAFWS